MTSKLYHGDCMEIIPTLEAGSIDAIITDIPYGEANRKTNGLRNLDKGKADISTFFLGDFLKECDRVTRGSFYIFCGFQQLSEIDKYFRENNISRRCIVWEKTNPSPMNAKTIWLSGIELCVYGKKKNAPFNSFYRNTVLRYPIKKGKIHPTEKPVSMFEELINISTNEGDTVLDACMGSGTTGIACKNTGRNFIGIEKDDKYFEIAKQRIGE